MIFSEGDHIKQIKAGTKTQTRRASDRYQIDKLYTLQPCRTCKGIPDGKILITAKRLETKNDWPPGWRILRVEAKAEGGYTPKAYEELYEKMHPGWEKRWAYLFDYFTTEELELIETDPDAGFALYHSRVSQQLRKTSVLRGESAEPHDNGEADTHPVPASSGREKEKKENV